MISSVSNLSQQESNLLLSEDKDQFVCDDSYPSITTIPFLEKFQFVKKMGEGAFSQVYHAINLETSEHVAIKIIEKIHLNSIQRESVHKEASVHASLRHPNIIALRQHFETSQHYVFILELAVGGELFHRIVELTYFSEDLARHVILQVAHGIHYLHHQVGVVHRDIKPENLLFTPIPFSELDDIVATGRTPGETKINEGPFQFNVGGGGVGIVKIADFGLSKVVWTDGTKTPCGTVGYTAPEIVKSQSYTASVDIWALGCVLYTMLCGFPPFHDEDQAILTQKVVSGQWSFLKPWWDKVSQSAKHLLTKLLEIRPERRYTIDQFFNHPWVNPKASEKMPLRERLQAVNRPSFYERQEHNNAIYATLSKDPSSTAQAFDWNSFQLPNLKTPVSEKTAGMNEVYGPEYNHPRIESIPSTSEQGSKSDMNNHHVSSNPWTLISQTQPIVKTPSQRKFKQFFATSYRAVNELAELNNPIISDNNQPSAWGAGTNPNTYFNKGIMPRMAMPFTWAVSKLGKPNPAAPICLPNPNQQAPTLGSAWTTHTKEGENLVTLPVEAQQNQAFQQQKDISLSCINESSIHNRRKRIQNQLN